MRGERGTADLGTLLGLLFLVAAPVAVFSDRVQQEVGEIGVYLGVLVATATLWRMANRFFGRIDRLEEGQRIIMRALGIEHPDEARE